jgi:membrane associated rhomboid family serine protease
MNSPVKTLSKMLFQKKAASPYVSLCIAVSCIVVSLPEYFRPDLYQVLAFLPRNPRWWQFLTFQFCHGEPGSGIGHLLGCLAGLFLFGLPIERILGSSRFFILTCATFLTCLVYNMVLFRDVTWANGASAMVMGYLVFTLPILAWGWRRHNSKLFQILTGIAVAGVILFLLLGLATLLKVIPSSHANILHAISILVGLPFLVLWYKPLMKNLDRIEKDEPIQCGLPAGNRLAVGASLGILLFNVVATSSAVAGLIIYDPCEGVPEVVSITPVNGDILSLNNSQQKVTIEFSKPMEMSVFSFSQSISYNDIPLDFVFTWSTPEILVVQFGREVFVGEQIEIVIDRVQDTRGLAICNPITLEYK